MWPSDPTCFTALCLVCVLAAQLHPHVQFPAKPFWRCATTGNLLISCWFRHRSSVLPSVLCSTTEIDNLASHPRVREVSLVPLSRWSHRSSRHPQAIVLPPSVFVLLLIFVHQSSAPFHCCLGNFWLLFVFQAFVPCVPCSMPPCKPDILTADRLSKPALLSGYRRRDPWAKMSASNNSRSFYIIESWNHTEKVIK